MQNWHPSVNLVESSLPASDTGNQLVFVFTNPASRPAKPLAGQPIQLEQAS
jgi:hypothetical protein